MRSFSPQKTSAQNISAPWWKEFAWCVDEREKNPQLGLRSIRFSLHHPELFREQLRAILRGGPAAQDSRIVFPMTGSLEEFRAARTVVDLAIASLKEEGLPHHPYPRLGMMIEVPSVVSLMEEFACEADCFSLGTNDLVQYLLAVDRGNEEVADWFRSLHPAVLQSIYNTLEAARAAFIPAVVCGEMAAAPTYAVILIGLGATDLSMTASSIPRVRRTVAEIKYTDAREIALECLECETADDVEDLVKERFAARWPHLFPPETLPAPKSKV